MSNPIRYDPPLVRALAAELHERLSGRPAQLPPVFAKDLSATLPLDRGQALRLDLHPSMGWVRIVPRPGGEGPPPEARIVGVTAPPDERRLRIELREGNRFRGGSRVLVVELHTNQWNALLVDKGTGRIVSVLRAREAGERPLVAGALYQPPAGEPRFGARRVTEEEGWEEWRRVLAALPPEERGRAMVRHFADASPLNAASLLGDAGEVADGAEEALRAAFGRWWAVHTAGKHSRPVLLSLRGGPQPYPVPLEGVEGRPVPSLLEAMSVAAEAREHEAGAAASGDLLKRARKRLHAARRRVEGLEAELGRVDGVDELRHRGDLILAYLHLVPVGASSARLPEFDGGLEVEIPLDPTLRPKDNAQKFYDEAARLERARDRLPGLLEAARGEGEAWARAVEALESGEAPPAVLRLLEHDEARQRKRAASAPKAGSGGGDGERKPYRLYRSSGGLEIRVGKTSRDNDRLTFGHSSPEDVWLHAREVPGSHVVLRWGDAGSAPPARDLEEAATLAAWYSKARTSGTVAVSWTRRKHVRKPRGAPPGRVSLLQAKTVFVEPSEEMEERLRAEAAGAAGE